MLKFKHGNYKQSYRMYFLILSVFRTIFKVSKHARVSSHILAWILLFSETVYQLQFEYKQFSILQSNLHILHGIDHIKQNIMFHIKYTYSQTCLWYHSALCSDNSASSLCLSCAALSIPSKSKSSKILACAFASPSSAFMSWRCSLFDVDL